MQIFLGKRPLSPNNAVFSLNSSLIRYAVTLKYDSLEIDN